MKIGVDVDGVLTDLESYQLKYGKKYFKNVTDINEDGYDICDIFHCSKEESEAFWTKYIWKYCLHEPVRPGMKELLQKLNCPENDIYIITSRAHTTEQTVVGDIFRRMLTFWLNKNEIPYKKIYYCKEDNTSEEKYDICRRLDIDVMIEDKKETIDSIQNIAGVLCISNKNNEVVKETDRIKKVSVISDKTYDDVIELSHKSSEKKINADFVVSFDKDQYRFNYGVIRNLGVPLFKLLLKPTILNKQYIPKNGPLLLCGNHLHVWDQFPVICATKRPTHWMSKKEYFDSKLGPFFEKTGAICVDRYGDAHQSTLTALNYLYIDSAVGLFPEGTRNHLKQNHIDSLYGLLSSPCVSREEFSQFIHQQNPRLSQILLLENMLQNKKISAEEFSYALNDVDQFLQSKLTPNEYKDSLLLPFKFGAVSMAQRSGATIVPFGVTGDYRIGNNNLIVNFGEGFQVRPDDSLEDANKKLRSDILNLLDENKKLEYKRK